MGNEATVVTVWNKTGHQSNSATTLLFINNLRPLCHKQPRTFLIYNFIAQ